jgi:hypothetical protein
MDERAAAVQRLIDDSARGAVDLTVLSGLELCALGATGQALFDTAVTTAWGALAEGAREMARNESLAGLARRQLLEAAGERGASEGGGGASEGEGGGSEGERGASEGERGASEGKGEGGTGEGWDEVGEMATELSVAMGARANPTFALVTEVDGADERSLKMFGLGDQDRPLQAVVVESPIAAPAGFEHLRRMGPLGWFYRYTLVSPAIAASLLIRWTGLALPRKAKGRVITTFRHPAEGGLTGDVVTVSSKGKLTRNGLQLDAATLGEVVSGLVTAS